MNGSVQVSLRRNPWPIRWFVSQVNRHLFPTKEIQWLRRNGKHFSVENITPFSLIFTARSLPVRCWMKMVRFQLKRKKFFRHFHEAIGSPNQNVVKKRRIFHMLVLKNQFHGAGLHYWFFVSCSVPVEHTSTRHTSLIRQIRHQKQRWKNQLPSRKQRNKNPKQQKLLLLSMMYCMSKRVRAISIKKNRWRRYSTKLTLETDTALLRRKTVSQKWNYPMT